MGDCLTDSCKDKECTKSHRRKCRDEESCRFYKIDNRALKHPPDKSAITNQTEEIINKINELMDMRDLGMMRKLCQKNVIINKLTEDLAVLTDKIKTLETKHDTTQDNKEMAGTYL